VQANALAERARSALGSSPPLGLRRPAREFTVGDGDRATWPIRSAEDAAAQHTVVLGHWEALAPTASSRL